MLVPVNGLYPKIHPSVWIAPTATIIGDVEIGEGSSVWYNTVIRGDVFPIKIGRETNIQDNCVLHCTYKKCGVFLGNSITVGHQVLLHGCTVKDGSFIGMVSVLMDNVVVGKHCLVGAGSLVTEDAVFDDETLILGRPAAAKRKLSPDEIKKIEKSADHYIMYTSWYAGKGGKIP